MPARSRPRARRGSSSPSRWRSPSRCRCGPCTPGSPTRTPRRPRPAPSFAPAIGVLGVIGVVYGSFMCMAQTDLKRLIAYSSVAHLGFVMLGLSALTAEAASGAVLQMVNHGISTGALFLMVGYLYERTHTRDLAAYGGLAKVAPAIAATFLVITLSSIGLPGTNGFVGSAHLPAAASADGPASPAVGGAGEMNFNPNDLYGVLPALILSAGALLLLTSEVFLRAVKPAQLAGAGGPAEAAQKQMPPQADVAPPPPEPAPDRRYQAWVAAAVAAAALWAALAQIPDPTMSLFSGAAISDGFARVIAAVVKSDIVGSGI